MLKTNNSVANQFEGILWNCDELMGEVCSTLKGCGYKKEDIEQFLERNKIISFRERILRDLEASNELTEERVYDVYTLGYIEDTMKSFENLSARANEALAQQANKQPLM